MLKRIVSALIALVMLVSGACFAEYYDEYVYIRPVGYFDETELGYVLSGDVLVEWFTDSEDHIYTFVVEDIYGFDVPGYSDSTPEINTGVTLYGADFEPGKVYTVTVYAYTDEYDTDPTSNMMWFVFDNGSGSGSVSTDTEAAGRRAVYNNFFDAHYPGDTPVILADVTGDGLDEMIILNNNDGFTAGSVLTVDGSGEVRVIYQNFMPHSHGGVCGWYLIPQPDGGYALLEESNELWQGIGNIYFTEYRLTETGEMVFLRNLWLSSDEPGCVDGNGMLMESLIDDYGMQLGDIISTGRSLFVHSSMSSAFVPAAEMSYDGAFMGYADASGSVDRIAERGLISMMGMEYMEIYFALTDMSWYDSFDFPGIWFLNGLYNGGTVVLEYYEQPDAPGAYPYCMRVSDMYGDLKLPVTSELSTGMTWAQVQQLDWVYLEDIEAYDGYAVAVGYPDQGCMMTMVFDDAYADSVLVSVTIEFFE